MLGGVPGVGFFRREGRFVWCKDKHTIAPHFSHGQ